MFEAYSPLMPSFLFWTHFLSTFHVSCGKRVLLLPFLLVWRPCRRHYFSKRWNKTKNKSMNNSTYKLPQLSSFNRYLERSRKATNALNTTTRNNLWWRTGKAVLPGLHMMNLHKRRGLVCQFFKKKNCREFSVCQFSGLAAAPRNGFSRCRGLNW